MNRRVPAPVDAPARDLALNPATSCIVQAPAGSGKTTLLVSRFIRLLALADYPEQVLAITFTRKAAAEMRLRVTAMFADGESREGARARARDAERGWQLAGNPSRLNIRTIDSFAMSLTRQMPVSSGFDRTARLVENASELHALAAGRLFRRLYTDDPLAEEIARFLALTDNDAQKARRLLAGMLARRDHWLDEVTEVVAAYRKAPQSVAGLLNGGLETLIGAVAGDLESLIPREPLDDLEWAVGFATGFDRSTPGAFWRAAGRLVTTGSGSLRKQLTRKDGFPPEVRDEKRRAMNLIVTVGALGLEGRFAALRLLPPEPLLPEQAQDLISICISLSLAVIDLSSVMRSQGVADFTELLLAARRALRSGENPTELALSIDNRIRHVLVDEFQDTSVVQYQLLELLVGGWSGESGVSLFAVGDPMQSIYRFRDADVGLFYRAESRGLDQMRLRPLRLAMNFRSAPRLVDWFNTTFPEVMGEEADPLLGRVPYNPCQAGVESGGEASVRLFETEEDERQAIIDRISTLLSDEPDARIALLVRSRTHLTGILDALRENRISWQATDIDALADTPAVTDLLTLAAAITNPCDRLAWYSLLRSPWVGLRLRDLEALAELPAWDIATLRAASSSLSRDGRRRLARLLTALEAWLPARHESPPRTVLESIWIHCGGPAAYGDEAAIDHAERFLELVDDLGSDGLDVDRLRFGADNLFAVESAAANLQILTIHKAKGLEFDHVLLPFLDRQTKPTEAPLLRWRLQENRLLMAARDTGPLYDWLAEEDKLREQHELQRLLYVGCTQGAAHADAYCRASRRASPARGSLLNLLWPRAAASLPVEASPRTPPFAVGGPIGRRACLSTPRRRLPMAAADQETPASRTGRSNEPPRCRPDASAWNPTRSPAAAKSFLATSYTPPCAILATPPLPDSAGAWIESRIPAWTRKSEQDAGLSEPDIEHCRTETARQITNVLEDRDGPLDSCRRLRSSFGIPPSRASSTAPSGRFVSTGPLQDGGERWVIDYKTGDVDAGGAQIAIATTPRQAPPATRPLSRAWPQELYGQPVRTALYLTALPRLIEV